MPHDLPMPDFLQEDVETIHRRMRKKAPPEINVQEGDFFWDATRPAAIEIAEIKQLVLQNILRLAFPQTSYGRYLEYLAETKGETRHPPTRSAGNLLISGDPGTHIPTGHTAYTEAAGDQPAVGFKFLESVTIDETGQVSVMAECLEPGVVGNVAAGTVVLLGESLGGVTSIVNPEPFTGGAEAESDTSLQEKTLAAYDEPLSGAKRDYIQWAKQVPGVGNGYIIPCADGPGTVTVLIVDHNGQPANQALVNAVQQHIAPDGRNGGGLAPIGALVTVGAPEVFEVDVVATLVLEDEYSLDAVRDDVLAGLRQFLAMEFDINTGDRPIDVITSTRIGYAVMNVDGVRDYTEITVNGAQSVDVPIGRIPTLGEVVLT